MVARKPATCGHEYSHAGRLAAGHRNAVIQAVLGSADRSMADAQSRPFPAARP
jgi:hypothetical protein